MEGLIKVIPDCGFPFLAVGGGDTTHGCLPCWCLHQPATNWNAPGLISGIFEFVYAVRLQSKRIFSMLLKCGAHLKISFVVHR